MINGRNIYNDFLIKTKNEIFINECLLIISDNIIELCHDIIDTIGIDNFVCVKYNDDVEYKHFLNKKIIIFINKYENYYDDINKILNREKILYRKQKDYRVNQIDPLCNIIIISKNDNITEKFKNISTIINNKNSE